MAKLSTKSTNVTVVQSPVEVTAPMSAEEIAQARAQVKALQEQLKAAKAAMPKANSLSGEILKQETSPNQSLRWLTWSMIRNRTQRGQPFDDAKAAVLAICANLIDTGAGKDTWAEVRNQ